MIPPALSAGIPDQGPCSDCTALPSPAGLKAGQGVFNRVLDALIARLEVKAAGALPVQGAIAAGAGSPAESESAGVAESLQVSILAAEEFDGVSDSAGGGAALTAASQAEVADQPAAAGLFGAWQLMPQPAVGAGMLPDAGREGSRGLAAGQATAATLAAGRQQLPLSLPVETADTILPGQVASASGQGDGETVLSRSIMADVTARPVPHALQPTTDTNAFMAAERPSDPMRTALSREVLTMQLPLRAQGWDGELAQRIAWMAGRQTQWAEITLNPPNLGNLEVHLSLKGNDASAYFYSPHAAVREAIDESLSRLREMLAGAGISLGQTQVSQESFGDRRGGGATGFPRLSEAGVELDAVLPAQSGRGLVDLYV